MKELMNGGNQVCAVSNNVSVSDTSDNKSVTISKVVNSKCTVECGEECSLLIMCCALDWLKANNNPLINGAFIDSYSIIQPATKGKTFYIINTK